jgi:hypothetical protein
VPGFDQGPASLAGFVFAILYKIFLCAFVNLVFFVFQDFEFLCVLCGSKPETKN